MFQYLLYVFHIFACSVFYMKSAYLDLEHLSGFKCVFGPSTIGAISVVHSFGLWQVKVVRYGHSLFSYFHYPGKSFLLTLKAPRKNASENVVC